MYIGRDHPLADSHGETSLGRAILWLLRPDTGDEGNGGWLRCAAGWINAPQDRPVSEGGVLVNWRLSPPNPDALYVKLETNGHRPLPMCRRHSKGKDGPCGGG